MLKHISIYILLYYYSRTANYLLCMNIKISISILCAYHWYTFSTVHWICFSVGVSAICVFVCNLFLIVSCLCHVLQNKCTLIIYVRTKYTRMPTLSVVFIYFYIIVAVFCTLVFIFQATVDFCTKTDLFNKLHLILPTNTSYPHWSFHWMFLWITFCSHSSVFNKFILLQCNLTFHFPVSLKERSSEIVTYSFSDYLAVYFHCFCLVVKCMAVNFPFFICD